MTVAVVTDSTADLPSEFMVRHRIAMVPLTVEYGGRSFYDRVDLAAEDFLRTLPSLREQPKTAAPAPGAFGKVYEEAFRQGADAVISIHLAAGLSATVRAAEIAARTVGKPIAVVDGESASLGTGLLVWWAAVRAAQGVSLEALERELSTLKTGLFALTAPITLEYLARGGRIGQAARMVGSILDVKPILLLEHGGFRPERTVRGERQIKPAMLSSLIHRVPPGSTLLAALGHSGQPDEHDDLIESVNARYPVLGWLKGVIGPAISTHVGPGAFGLIIMPVSQDMADMVKGAMT
jgi:DegV family protein with EDD domain